MPSKTFKLFFKLICAAAALLFVTILAFWGAVGYGAYKTGSAINEHGLKSVVDKVWNGKNIYTP